MWKTNVWACAIASLLGFGAPASAANITGEFWDVAVPVESLNEALAYVARTPPTATFDSSGIDYPVGAPVTLPDSTSLATFLGADAASLSGDGNATLEESVFRFSGFVAISTPTSTVTVGSDDGFQLTIGGFEISSFQSERAFNRTSVSANLGTGILPFDLVSFENQGVTGIEFEIDGETVTGVPDPATGPTSDPTLVPLPASGLALLIGLGLFVAIAFFGPFGRRRID